MLTRHPIGFLLAQTYPMDTIWFSIFLGWFAKVTISRFGGNDTYRQTTPLFLVWHWVTSP